MTMTMPVADFFWKMRKSTSSQYLLGNVNRLTITRKHFFLRSFFRGKFSSTVNFPAVNYPAVNSLRSILLFPMFFICYITLYHKKKKFLPQAILGLFGTLKTMLFLFIFFIVKIWVFGPITDISVRKLQKFQIEV